MLRMRFCLTRPRVSWRVPALLMSRSPGFARYAAKACKITPVKRHEPSDGSLCRWASCAGGLRWLRNISGACYVLFLFRKSHNMAVELALDGNTLYRWTAFNSASQPRDLLQSAHGSRLAS